MNKLNMAGNGNPPDKRQRREMPVEQDPVDDAPAPVQEPAAPAEPK